MDQSTEVVALSATQRTEWETGILPTVENLGGGLLSVPVAIPAGNLPATFCYVLLGDDGVHLIDPGWESDANEERLRAALCDAGRSLDDVRTVIVTHHHPDHLGMAVRLRARSGAKIVLSGDERVVLTAVVDTDRRDPAAYRLTLARWGVPEGQHEELSQAVAQPSLTGDVEPDLIVNDGDVLVLAGRRLEIVSTPGHTGGHICLIDRSARLLFSGDHVLPRIYSGVGLGALPGVEPMGAMLASLQRLAEFDDYSVLPGHEFRFRGLGSRRAQIAAHHLRRTAEVAALREELGERSVWDYASKLTWTSGWEGLAGFWLHSALWQTQLHLQFVESGAADVWLRSDPQRN